MQLRQRQKTALNVNDLKLDCFVFYSFRKSKKYISRVYIIILFDIILLKLYARRRNETK